MKRQTDWEELWQGGVQVESAPVDRWAPWVALLAGLAIAIVGNL